MTDNDATFIQFCKQRLADNGNMPVKFTREEFTRLRTLAGLQPVPVNEFLMLSDAAHRMIRKAEKRIAAKVSNVLLYEAQASGGPGAFFDQYLSQTQSRRWRSGRQ